MTVKGPARIRGFLKVPGDKSISHRVAMLASIADGPSQVTGFASSVDCWTTIECIRKLGIQVEESPGSGLVIHGRGLFGYRPDEAIIHLDAGNSGSTIRMLSGILAGQQFTSEITGDPSLRRRPMARIIKPLELMGARIEATGSNLPPLTIHGGKLRSISYSSPVASAQVKTCVLFAGLLAEGRTSISELAASRNHTELMLREFGAKVYVTSSGGVFVEGLHDLSPVNYQVPGDVSSAAFFIAGASILQNSALVLRDINLNPTRTAFIDVLKELGASVRTQNLREQHGELLGDIMVTGGQLRSEREGTVLSGALIPNMIDEIPILAVVATQVEGRIEVRDAKELRIKESDRIRTVAEGIRSLGGEIEEFEDGFAINGPQRLTGGRVETAGDHRIAMAFAIAGLIAEGTTEIIDAECASVSFPEFFESVAALTGSGTVGHTIRTMSVPQDNTPIFLVGFMGAGKTTVGKALALHLGYSFLDLDDLITSRLSKSVQEIFADLGEAEFRRLEKEAVQSCSGMTHTVVALGGGAYVAEENRTLLRGIGKTVWLDCPIEVCMKRISGDKSRPLLGDENEMKALLSQRRVSYAQADYVIGSGDLTPDDLASRIASLLSQ